MEYPGSHGMWLGILLAFFTVFLGNTILLENASAQALPDYSVEYVSLFEVPLEQLININVQAEKWNGKTDNGIFVIAGRSLKKLSRQVKRFSRQWSDDDYDSFGDVSQRERRILLAIDGYRVGNLENFSDFLYYTRFYGRNLDQVELYLGESARWWDEQNPDVVINIVTDRREIEKQRANKLRKEALVE